MNEVIVRTVAWGRRHVGLEKGAVRTAPECVT